MPPVPMEKVVEEIRRSMRRGDYLRAVPLVREIVRQAPRDPRSRLLQGMMALAFDHPGEAARLLEPLPFELPGEDGRFATVQLARARLAAGDPAGALLTIGPVCEASPDLGPAVAVKAEALNARGQADEADACLTAWASGVEGFEVAIARGRLALRTRADDGRLGARMAAADEALTAEREHVGVPASALSEICLLLGEIRARQGDDGSATTLFKRSAALNPTKADVRPYAQTVMRLTQSWSDAALARAQRLAAGEADGPVFVVGMPGGGPELAASLLALSPRVRLQARPEALTSAVGRHLVGGDGGDPIVQDPARLSAKQLRSAAEAYAASAGPLEPPQDLLVDAFGLNLHVLGVVGQLFPRARVVFVRRDPFDACFACMLRHREARLLYASDPRSLAVFAGGLRRLEVLWSSVFEGSRLPLETLTVDYAGLLAGDAGGLFAFAGLETPSEPAVSGAIAEHARWTAHGVGLHERFGARMPELADSVRQAEIGMV